MRIHCDSPTLCRWQAAIARSELARACEKSDQSSNTKKLANARSVSTNCVTFYLQFPRLIRTTNRLPSDKGVAIKTEMHLTRTAQYALRLSLTQPSTSTTLYRRNSVDRGTASAFFLATAGLSLSMFSLVQMQSSPAHQNRLRRLH